MGVFQTPGQGGGWAAPGTGNCRPTGWRRASPGGLHRLAALFLGFWPKQLLGKEHGVTVAGGTCFHGVWLTLEDDGATGPWGPARQEPGLGERRCGRQGWPAIHRATRCRGAGGGPGRRRLGGRGTGCQACVLAGAKPDQGPVGRASAVRRGPGHGASLTHEPLLCSNWVRLNGNGPECLTLPDGHQR